MKFLKKSILFGSIFLSHNLNSWGKSAISESDTLRLSLNDVWHRADEYSRDIKIRKTAVGVSSEEIKDAKAERLPEWNVAGSLEKATNIPIYENGIFHTPVQHEVIHTLYKAGTDFYLNIYNGNKLNLKIKEGKMLNVIATIRKDQTISDTRYKAAALYLDLQKSIIFRDLMIHDIADQEKQLMEIKELHKNGVVLKSDVLRVEMELSRRKMTLVEIRNDILIANQKLNILIGEPDDRIVHPVDVFNPFHNVVQTYEGYLGDAMHHSFPFQISEKQTELSQINLSKVKANVRPKIGMYGEFYFANPQIFLYPYNPYWYSLGIAGVKASFPLSSLYHNVHKVRAAKLELEKEEEIHKDTEDKVRQQVLEAFLRYKEALLQIDVAKVNLEHAVENERIIKNTYFNQTSLVTDLLDANVQELQSRFELAAAQIMAQNKFYLLQNVTGIL